MVDSICLKFKISLRNLELFSVYIKYVIVKFLTPFCIFTNFNVVSFSLTEEENSS
jgi:hypothetical protein